MAELVADDQVAVSLLNGRLYGRAPETIAGRIEVRGLGIIETPYMTKVELTLAAELSEPNSIERMPGPLQYQVFGHRLPMIRLAPFEASAPVKLILALFNRALTEGG